MPSNISQKTIRKLLIELDLKTSEIAKKLGYSHQHVCNVINEKARSKKLKNEITLLIGEEYLKRIGPVEGKDRDEE